MKELAANRLRVTLAQALSPERKFAERFYLRLFTARPEVRSMFKPDMARQEARLAEMLAFLVDQIEDPVRVEPVLTGLGKRHTVYRVAPEHYIAMESVLLITLAECVDDWTEEDAQTWREAYRALVEGMTQK